MDKKLQNSDASIVVHHVGGRGGAAPMPIDPRYHQDFVYVVWEADPDCRCQEDMERVLRTQTSQHIVMPFCVGKDSSQVRFNINFDPYASSFLTRGSAANTICTLPPDGDWMFRDTLRPLKSLEMTSVSMDQILESHGCSTPLPDVLVLDTQGSELDILEGAIRTLERRTLVVIAESEMVPFYEGQKLFGDICNFMERNGFRFMRFGDTNGSYNNFRSPIGLRGRGAVSSCEAYFVRKVESL